MSFSLLAGGWFAALTDISPELLLRNNISLLLLDLDNTIAPYGQAVPDDRMLQWAETIKAAGVALYILSNSKKSERVKAYAEALGIGYTLRARKPSRKALINILNEQGFALNETALCGDQIFTDTLCGNNAGILTFLVEPIALQNIALKARYFAEKPFRKISKGRKKYE